MNKTQNLIEFEDSIRIEALPLDQALEFKKHSSKQIYVVGEGIGKYLKSLRALGFNDLWEELYEEGKDNVKEVFKKNKRSEES